MKKVDCFYNTLHSSKLQPTMAKEKAFKEVAVKKNYKLVPPDGGYGYIILVAACILFISVGMFVASFGMIFNDFFITLGMGATDINLLAGIFALGSAVAGYFNGPLLKVLSRRQLAFVTSLVFNGGCLGAVFVNSKMQFILCQGLLKGMGSGLLYDIACSVLNDYFVEKRLLTISVALTMASVSAMVAPMLVKWSNEELGFRGSLIIISAISMQTFVASALLQPVAWHMKKVRIEDVPENERLMLTELPIDEDKKNPFPETTNKDVEMAESFKEENRRKATMKTSVIFSIQNFFDWPLVKRYGLKSVCVGAAISVFVDWTFLNFLAQALYQLKWNADQVKWAYALLGFGDISARFLIILTSSWLKNFSNQFIYVLGLTIAIVTKTMVLWVNDHIATLVILTVMGVSRCIIMMLFPLVISDAVTVEEFPSAIGITMCLFGLISIIVGPIIGAIHDVTHNNMVMFLILIGLLLAVTVAWIVEMLRKWSGRAANLRNCHRRPE